MATYNPLITTPLMEENKLRYSAELPELVYLDDPATAVMIDFKYTVPFTIQAGELIDHAIKEMKVSGVQLLIVTDLDEKVVGLINSEDLLGEKLLKVIRQRCLPRSEIRVRLVMTPQKEIAAIDIDALRHAKVAHIIETLKKLKQHYLLVTKTHPRTGIQSVIGLFSSSQISKQLHLDITSALSAADSIAELQKRHT